MYQVVFKLVFPQLTTSSTSGSEVVDVSVIWSGPGVDPPHAIDTLNDSSGKSMFNFILEPPRFYPSNTATICQ